MVKPHGSQLTVVLVLTMAAVNEAVKKGFQQMTKGPVKRKEFTVFSLVNHIHSFLGHLCVW